MNEPNLTAERPTPQTDAHKIIAQISSGFHECVSSDFARKLERERDEAREGLEIAVTALRSLRERARDKVGRDYEIAHAALEKIFP